MHAAFIRQTGPPEVIQYGELPDPRPAPDQVLVRMQAVAVNPIDTYIRNGANYWPLPEPYVIGADIAGTVEAVGAAVKDLSVGDRVWGTNQGFMGRQGTFAELCAIDAQWLHRLPDSVSYEDAAACALVGVTAHLGLFGRAALRAGETLLVHGGAGGVGSLVMQMAKIVGARVIATAGSEVKAGYCRGQGADRVILHQHEDLADAVSEFAPQGVNVFWETAREPSFDAIVPLMADRGRIVLMAGRDARPEFPVGPFYVKGCSLHGFVMFKATAAEMRRCAEDINRWLGEGSLQANIGQRFPLSRAADAHGLQEDNTLRKAGTLIGKIVLTP